jgi:hypothetical protein
MVANRDRATATALEALRLADRYDDGSERAGVLAQVHAQVSTTYAVLALLEAKRPHVEVLERGVDSAGQHLWVIVDDESRDGARLVAETYGHVIEADETLDGRWSHEVVTTPECQCDALAHGDEPHAPGCPVNEYRIARAAELGDSIE